MADITQTNNNDTSITAYAPQKPCTVLGNKVSVVLGAQYGDEGKGKFTDLLATDADIVCRCAGGNNAGHTVVVDGTKYYFRLLPSGFVNPKGQGVLGNGVVIYLPELFDELEAVTKLGLIDVKDRLIISDRAHLVFDLHKSVDKLREMEAGKKSIGTTLKGIGPCYSSKAGRTGIRVCDLVGDFQVFSDKYRFLVNGYKRSHPSLEVNVEEELLRYKNYAESIRPMVRDTVVFLNNALKDPSKNIVIEGANAIMLDIDFGTYPFVTSSNCSIGGAITGLGIPPHKIGEIYGVVRAYTTRIAKGGFPTELTELNQSDNEVRRTFVDKGNEYEGPGIYGCECRCGWLDTVQLCYANMLNGFTALALTKLDILTDFEEIKIGVAYKHDGKTLSSYPAYNDALKDVEVEYITLPGWKSDISKCRKFDDLPSNAQAYVLKCEELIGVPIKWVGVGPSRDATITRF